MQKAIGLVVVSLVLSTTPVFGGPIKFVKSSESTNEDIDLEFKPQKSNWEHGKVHVWGKVKNTSQKRYKYVKVTFTAFDEKGEFLGRDYWFVDPSTLDPGNVGYITENYIKTEGQKPSRIEIKVTGCPD